MEPFETAFLKFSIGTSWKVELIVTLTCCTAAKGGSAFTSSHLQYISISFVILIIKILSYILSPLNSVLHYIINYLIQG